MQSLMIIGRRWFQRGSGNTYHTATIYVDGKCIHKSEITYGYGEHFLHTAGEWLEANGYMPERRHWHNGGADPLWKYFRDDRGVNYSVETIDVDRKKDL